jgi:transcriptional regulator with XRE-family HTH domain
VPRRAIPISDDYRRRQSAVLARLRTEADLNPTEAGARVGVSYSQWLRYESGETPVPPAYFDAISRGFGVSKTELTIAFGLLSDVADEADWDPKAVMLAEGISKERAVQILGDIHGLGLDTQQAVVAAQVMLHRERAAEAVGKPAGDCDEASA